MNRLIQPQLSAADTARAVAGRRLTAEDRIAAALARMEEVQPALNPFTILLRDEAMAAARATRAA